MANLKCGLDIFFVAIFLFGFIISGIECHASDGVKSRGEVDALEHKPEKRNFMQELHSMVDACLPHFQLPLLDDSKTNAQYLDHSQTFCSNLTAVRQCMTMMANVFDVTQNGTYDTLFEMYQEMLDSILERLCVDNGDKLSSLLYGYKKNEEKFDYSRQFMPACFIDAISKIEKAFQSNSDLASKVWIVYQELQIFRECFIRTMFTDRSFVTFAVQQINATLDTMKCIHPKNRTIILCKSIKTDSINKTDLCPFAGSGTTQVPMSYYLLILAKNCFDLYDPNYPQLSVARSAEEVSGYFKNYCLRGDGFKHCLSEKNLIAELCVDQVELQKYQLNNANFEMIMDAACFEDGRRLAAMFRNSTNERGPVQKCLYEAQAQSIYSIDLYRHFEERVLIKTCLLNTGEDNTAFKDALDEMSNEVWGKMKCLSPDDGSEVLCTSINN